MTGALLLVDDSEDIRHLFRWRLRELGMAYHAVEDAEAGWELAHRLDPSLVLLDVNLGEESGLELCRRLRGHPATATLAIAMFSASDDVEAQIRSLDAGADDHLAKSLTGPLLLARCRALVRRGERLRGFAAENGLDRLTGARIGVAGQPRDRSGPLHGWRLTPETSDPITTSGELGRLGALLRVALPSGWQLYREEEALVAWGPEAAFPLGPPIGVHVAPLP